MRPCGRSVITVANPDCKASCSLKWKATAGYGIISNYPIDCSHPHKYVCAVLFLKRSEVFTVCCFKFAEVMFSLQLYIFFYNNAIRWLATAKWWKFKTFLRFFQTFLIIIVVVVIDDEDYQEYQRQCCQTTEIAGASSSYSLVRFLHITGLG